MPALRALIDALQVLPGVGERSATRMAYHVLQHDKLGGQRLAAALQLALEQVRHCEQCHTLSQTSPCSACADTSRDDSKLCVVQTPADQAALERTQRYKGRYFVLLGALNPLDGVGPKALQLERLFARLHSMQTALEQANAASSASASAADAQVMELLIATNFTAEGELTAHVVTQYCQAHLPTVKITRMTRGLPAGAELEYLDISTLAHALAARRLASLASAQ